MAKFEVNLGGNIGRLVVRAKKFNIYLKKERMKYWDSFERKCDLCSSQIVKWKQPRSKDVPLTVARCNMFYNYL